MSLTHSKDLLSSIASQLDSFEDIVTLKKLGKEFNEQLSSPEFAKYYHWRKHGYNPPEVISYWIPDEHRLEDTPWRLEFSFIPLKFFFWGVTEQLGDELYLNALLAYKNALSEKQEQEAKFISHFFGLEIPDLDKYTLVISPSSEGDLTRKQIDFVTRVYDEARNNKTILYRDMRNLTEKYITSLAQYGDIEYFEEILSSKLASEEQHTPKEYVSARTLALGRPSRQSEEPPPLSPDDEKERIRANFTESMIEQGKERLLEAYNKYQPKMEEYHVYIPTKYHPDQWKIEDVDRDRLRVLEAASISNEELFSLIKDYKEEGEFIEEIEAEIDNNLDFLKWMIRHHPELVPDWYANMDNIYLLTKFHQEIEDVGHHLDTYVLPAYASVDVWTESKHPRAGAQKTPPQEGSWEEIIAWTEFSDRGLKELLRKITNDYHTLNYPLFFEILEWDEEKTLALLRELREVKRVRRGPPLMRSLERKESYPKYSYNLLLAALST